MNVTLAGRVFALDRAVLEALMRDVAAGVVAARREPERPYFGHRPPQNVAVVGVQGLLEYRRSILAELFGTGTSTSELRRTFRALGANSDVKSILMIVDSPGGEVAGMKELSAVIREVRRRKPVTAVVDVTAASAAYWVASQASEVVVSPSGSVGSVGVFGVHEDRSALAEKVGVKVTLVSAGRYKTEGSPFEPLGDEARAEMQRQVDRAYRQFVEDLAMGRMVSPGTVERTFGEGRMVDAQDAVRAGMANRVGTVDEVVTDILVERGRNMREIALRRERAAALR